MAQATAIENAVAVVTYYDMDFVGVVEVDCKSYEQFASLPVAVHFAGRVYGRSCWNSDHDRAYYRTDKPVAIAVA